MSWIVVVVAVLAIVLFVVAKQGKKQKAESGFPYKKLPALFTPAERSFFGVLDLAAGKDFRLFGKVRIADVLAPRDGLNKSVWQTSFNKINRKHFDFVLCAPGDLSVVCAIELNDKSHQKRQRQDRDEFLVGACLGAGVPLISFQAQHAYSPSEVSAKIAEALSGSLVLDPIQGQASAPNHIPQNETASSPEQVADPMCPRCSSAMVKRTAKGGENAGHEFWGCSNFPKCREITNI